MMICCLVTGSHVMGQTFPGESGQIIPPGAPAVTIGLTTANCTVSGVGVIGQGCTKLDNVTIDITHTYTGDLGIFIISPGGDILELTSGNGGTGNNFTNTVFTDNTTPFITSGVAPYTGIWRPEGRQQSLTTPYSNANPLGTYTFDNVFDGVNADGVWTLYINDFLLVDVGVVNSWSITFTGGPGPVPEVTLGPDVIMCEDQSTTLIAEVINGPDTWEWSTGETTSSITVSPPTTTTYMVTVTNNGCTDADTIVVNVQPNTINANAGLDEIICEGEQVILHGSSGGSNSSFLWSTGQVGPLINVSPTNTTLYTLTVTDGVCSGTDEVEVMVNPAPVADAGPDVNICESSSTLLEASGGTQSNQYVWSNGQNTQSIIVSPSSTTTYTVTVTVDGCEGEDDVEVTVLPQPTVDAGDDETICIGETLVLNASGSGGFYEWSTGQTGSQISISPTTSTSYTVSLTEDGCTATDDIEVDVIDVVADATPDFSMCQGESEVISASGGMDYEWSTGQTSPAITISPSTYTVYTVTVSEGNCSDVATVQVNVIPAPAVNISPPQDICAGDTIIITVSGGTSYQWSNGASGSSQVVSPLTTTLYTVTVSDSGCSTTAAVQVTVHPSPVISIGPPMSLCEGDTVILQVTGLSGNEMLLWNTGDTSNQIQIAPTSDASYAVTATDPYGCIDESNLNITVLPAPVANAGPDMFITAGGLANLSATGGGTYLWSTGETTSTISVSPMITTSYTLTVTLNGCTDVDEVTVFVNEVPPVNLGADLTICPGETITLDATVPGPFVLQYQWNTGETSSIINVMPLSNSTYIVTVTDGMSGFSSVDTVFVFVGSLPQGQPVIAGPVEGCLQGIDVYTSSGVSGATTYMWLVNGGNIVSGQGTPSVNISWTNAGPQSVTLVVANDCGALPPASFNTDILVPPALPGPVLGLSNPCVYALSAYSIPILPGVSLYQWTVTGGGLITSGQGASGIVVDWNGAVAGQVCVEAVNICGVSTPLCLDVVPTQSPIISAGPDLETCDLQLTMQGSGGGTWNIVSGNGMLTITNPADPQTTVIAAAPGFYSLVYKSGTAGCEASDTAVIQFHPAPVLSQVIEVCNSDLTSYTVSFQITGGQAPYLVNGSVTSSNPFVSAQIPAGNSYSFQVEDSHGCLSATITGDQSCDCLSGAGQMDTTTIIKCIGDSLMANLPSGYMTGPGDTLAFILHDGQIPGGILAWSFEPAFPFLPSIQSSKTYYISAVTGMKGADGFPDVADPCFSWSTGTPFLFYNPPVIDILDKVTIPCDPQQVQLDIGGSSTGPDFQYLWTATNGGILLGAADATVAQAIRPGTYHLTISHPLSGCRSEGEIIVGPDHVDIDSLLFSVDAPFCAGDCNGEIMIIQSGLHWLFDFGDGVFTNAILPVTHCPGSYVLTIKNETGCIADTVYTIPDVQPLSVDLGPDRTIHPGESVEIHATSPGNIVDYIWMGTDTCSGCATITVYPEQTTSYQIEVIDDHGCMATDQILITVLVSKDIFLPNVFSPNGDQINDELFIPPHQSLTAILRFEVYDRWGTLVFHATDPMPGSQGTKWNGTFRESILNPGVYTCIAEVEFSDGATRHLVWDATLVK